MVVQGKGGIGQKESRGKKIKNGYKETLRGEIYSFFELNQWIHGYIYIYVAVLCLVTQLCPTLCDPTDCSPPGFSVHGDSPGNNTGVGCHALLQGIFPTQESNPRLLAPALPPGKPHAKAYSNKKKIPLKKQKHLSPGPSPGFSCC